MSRPAPVDPAPAIPCAESPIADAVVFVHCAHTSLRTLRACGMLERELPLYRALFGQAARTVMVSYGGAEDAEIARGILPEQPGRLTCLCNERGQDPALFLSAVPDRVRAALEETGAGSALVLTDQHYGGDVAVCIARALRHRGVRTGLAARGGYHWCWFVAREQGADSSAYAQARYLEGELVHAADVVIGTTQRMIDDLAMLHGAPAGRFRLVPNYVVIPAGQTDTAREPGLIVSAGRLHPQKRFDLLMRAAAAMPPVVREGARLVIHGEGPEEGRLRSLAASLPVRVEIRGRVPHGELVALMRRCAVYAQASAYEGHPKTIIEALAHGCPTIVTDGPGVCECVVAGATGVVVPGRIDDLSAGLTALITDPALGARLGAAAAERTRRTLSFDAVWPRYRAACAEAMAIAGTGATLPPAVVRWDQPLLRLAPDAAATTWEAGIAAFARRLEPDARAAFLERLAERLEQSRPAGAGWH